jgi:hypothetical protein
MIDRNDMVVSSNSKIIPGRSSGAGSGGGHNNKTNAKSPAKSKSSKTTNSGSTKVSESSTESSGESDEDKPVSRGRGGHSGSRGASKAGQLFFHVYNSIERFK